ncbi:MAG: NAD(P)H-hydrate dehydratase [Lachnospiraceae bacterium]|nr:NAD(P)H-hydrate dehydratase [Lachnospiraceae bacterium]
MEYILTAEEKHLADGYTSEKMYVSSAVLMERAALAACDVLTERKLPLDNICIACGPGNNGGDGLALARILAEKGKTADIVLPGGDEKMSETERLQYSALLALCPDISITDHIPEKQYTLIIDALFGISLNRNPQGAFLDAIKTINILHDAGAFTVSLDIPSGVNATTGRVMGMAVMADITTVFGFKCMGNVLYPGAVFNNEVILKDIGITKRSLQREPGVSALSDEDIALPERIRYSNKGTFGKVLLIAGSQKMSGAAVLSANAAFRSGCGMVRVYTVRENREILQETVPEAIVSVYDEEDPLAGLDECFDWCDVVAIGPGLSFSESAKTLVRHVLENSPVPIVADADALNIASTDPGMLINESRDIIITPHVGEMSRLTGLNVNDITEHLLETAVDFAESYNVICVLKDARTVIADTSKKACINLNGNSGMATAGSGDVLTGIIAALLAQGMDPYDAACSGCAIHGKAGDAAAEKLGEAGVMARDIIAGIR